METGGHNLHNGIRKLMPACFNFRGFHRDFKFLETTANSHLYKQEGNSVTVTLIQKYAEVVFETLEASEKDSVKQAKC